MAWNYPGYEVWDGDFQLLKFDEDSRTAVWVKDLGDGWEVREDQYAVEEVFDANAEFEKSSHGRKFGDWVRIASVPSILAERHELDKALREGDRTFLSRFFNDPDHAKLRTSRGRF